MSAPTYQHAPFSNQAKTIDDPTKARIYLMRKEKFVGASVGVQFYGSGPDATGPQMINSDRFHLIGEVGPDSYICWEETPRPFRLELNIRDAKSFQSIDLQAGHVYYLQAYLHTGWSAPSSRICILTEKEGQEMLKGCRPPSAYRKQK
jgi:hypothetical protein